VTVDHTPDSDRRAVRLLLVDDHPVVTSGLVMLLEAEPTVEVVGVAASVREAKEMVASATPNVVLVDFRLPDGTGVDVARFIHEQRPGVAVVFLSADSSQETLVAAVDSGASGFLPKSAGPRAIVNAVLCAADGEMLIPAQVLADILRAKTSTAREIAAQERELKRFTARELEILTLMVRGLDNAAMADHLIIGMNTVRWHVRQVLEKLDAHSKLEAVARAVELGLVRRY
jgi:DNA-binding NarL/FixJ family response regulator